MNSNSAGNLIKLIIKASLLAIVGVFFPLVYILFPAFFVTDSLKEGIVKVMGAFIIVCLFVGVVASPLMGIALLTLFGPMILLFHYLIVNRYSVNTTILLISILFFVSMIVVGYTLGFTPETLKSQDTINNFIQVQKQLFEQNGQNFNISKSEITELYNRTLQLIPSVLLLISLFIAYITYLITGRNLLKSNKLIMQPNSFIFFRLPSELIISGIIGTLGVFLLQSFIGEDYKVIIDNIVLVYSVLLFIEGLSLLKFLMARARVANFLQIIVIISSFLIPGIQIIFSMIGFLDVIFNFRKIPS